jgi:hypothetical protein
VKFHIRIIIKIIFLFIGPIALRENERRVCSNGTIVTKTEYS